MGNSELTIDLNKQNIDKVIKDFLEHLKKENFIPEDKLKLDLFIDDNKAFKIRNVSKSFSEEEIARKIDHTNLKPDTSEADIRKLCEEAISFNVCTVCINPSYITFAKSLLETTETKICTVIGFPLGAMTTKTKVFETEDALAMGADEIDMVLNIGALRNCNFKYVYEDIKKVADKIKEVKKDKALLKVIFETCLLNDEEKIKATIISILAGAQFVKTSTGFSKSGAVIKDVALMNYVGNGLIRVKASGGIKDKNIAELMISNGASRLGTSSSTHILMDSHSITKY